MTYSLYNIRKKYLQNYHFARSVCNIDTNNCRLISNSPPYHTILELSILINSFTYMLLCLSSSQIMQIEKIQRFRNRIFIAQNKLFTSTLRSEVVIFALCGLSLSIDPSPFGCGLFLFRCFEWRIRILRDFFRLSLSLLGPTNIQVVIVLVFFNDFLVLLRID